MTRLRGNVTHHPFLTLYIILIPKASEISYIQRWLQWGRNVSIILDQNFMTVLSQKLLKINSLHSILPGRKCQVKTFFRKQTSLGINCGLLGLTWFCWCGHAHWRRMGIFSGAAVTGLSPAAWTIIHVVIRVAANWSLACVLLRKLCIHCSVACIAWCACAMCTLCREQLRRDFSPRGNTPCTPPISGMVVCLSGVQRYPGIFKVRNLLFTFLDQLKRADLLAACFWSYTNITLCWVGCASAALDKPDRSNSGDCFAWFLSQVELPVEKHTTAVWGTDAWRGAC